jgi:hypothetical protein
MSYTHSRYILDYLSTSVHTKTYLHIIISISSASKQLLVLSTSYMPRVSELVTEDHVVIPVNDRF